ncbi:MAG: hypothetical protein ACLQE9_01830 [Roseiarcus sp.]
MRAPSLQSGFGLFGRLIFAALLALLAVKIVRLSAGDLLRSSNPELSILFDPGQSAARLMLSRRPYLEEGSRLDEAKDGAQEALGDNPLSPAALTSLGRAFQGMDDDGRATDLMRWASRVDLRNLESEIWLLDQDIRDGDVATALERVDALFRGQTPQTLDPLTLALAPALTSEPYRLGFVALLRSNPQWRSFVLGRLSAKSTDLRGLSALFANLQDGENPPTTAELQAFLARLADEGTLDQAYLAWTKSLSPDRLRKLGYLYNARFQYALTNLPFDWVFAPAPQALINVDTESGRRILNVDFFGGRVQFENVSHLLSLAPGNYRFSGQERSENLQNERGLWWRLFCVGKSADTLAATDLMIGDNPWREFGIDFEIPKENCAYQKLVLELPARVALESEITGGASYVNLQIEAK